MGGLPNGKEILSDLFTGVGDGVKSGGAGALLVGLTGDFDENMFLSLGVEGVGGAGRTGLRTTILLKSLDLVVLIAAFTAFLNS